MATTPRDSQFAHFAELLVNELLQCRDGQMDASDYWREQANATIARRAYDLVQHTINHVNPIALEFTTKSVVSAAIPDMTEWPVEDHATYESWLTTRPDPAEVERARVVLRRRMAGTEEW